MKISVLSRTALAFGLVILCTGCGRESRTETGLRNVVLTRVSSLTGEESVDYPGVVEEGASVGAAFMADGKISTILVKEGDRVHKGELLATLDDSDYRIGVSQLETQLNQMTKEKERMDAMYAKHNIAPNDYEKFEAGYEQLRLQLEMAKRQLGYTRLYAPANGYVSKKYLNPGELTGAGTPVFTITDDSSLVANVDLPVGAYLERNRILSATGRVPGIEGEIPLSMISFTPDADNNMLYRLKLAIPASVAKELTPGMNISVCIKTAEGGKAESTVPSRAIFSDQGDSFVWVYNPQDSTIHRKRVEIEGVPSGKMSLVKGLSGDEDIVETGVKQLYEGEKVNVLNRKETGI